MASNCVRRHGEATTRRGPARGIPRIAVSAETSKKYRMAHPERWREIRRRWRERNRESERVKAKAWFDANPERHKELRRRHYLKHAEEIKRKKREQLASDPILRGRARAANRRWAKANPVRRRCLQTKREAKRRGNGGSHTAVEWITLCWSSGWRCCYCGIHLTAKTVTRDHLVPLSRGGTDNIDNIAPACGPCNYRKHTKTETEFRAAVQP